MRTLTAIALIALLSGCTTVPAYQTARVNCLQYANASCIAAMIEGQPAGVVHCYPLDIDGLHAVTWVLVDGEQIFWDAANDRKLTQRQLGRVSAVTEGPSMGAFEIVPPPRVPSNIVLPLREKRNH